MKRQKKLSAAIALSASVILAAAMLAAVSLLAACNEVAGLGSGVEGLGNGGKQSIVEFSGSAEVRGEAQQIIRLTLSNEVGTSLELKGTSGFTLKAGSGDPVHLSKAKWGNGILGQATFESGNPKTALLWLDGWITSDDKDLELSYDASAGGLYANGTACNSFTIPVTNRVTSTEGPAAPDANATVPELKKATVYDTAPKHIILNFNVPVILTSTANFKVVINNTVQAEIASSLVSSAGCELILKSGIGYGDNAVLFYTKGEIEADRVISENHKELESLNLIIDNLVLEGTDPNGGTAKPLTPGDSPAAPPGAGATLTGLKVSLPRINWLQSSTGEELMNALSVTAVYSDSGIKVLSANEYTLNPAIPTETVGNNRRITVVYIDESSGIIASDKIAINVLASGTALPELVGLSLTVPRTAWAAGEVFVPTVTAAYSDSSYGTIPEGQYTLSPANPTQSVAENLIVSASYTAGGISKSGSTAIDVKAAKSEIPAISGIIATMEKRVWAKYEPFSVNVVAIYEDGTRGVVEQGYTLSPTSPTAADGHNITVRVSYRGYTAPLNIDVNTSENFSLTLSSIGAVPTKTTWLQNSPFSVVVTATYSDGSSGTISKGYSIDTESPTANVGSAIPISVSYKNQTSTFDIKVVGEVGMFAPLTRITAMPNKGVPASYMFNEDYSITVNAYYGESDEPLQVMYFTTDPVNITATTTGTVPVTVTYTDNEITKTTSFNIIVNPIIIGSVNGGKTAILDLTDYVNVPEAKVNPDIEGGFNTYFTISSIVWKDGVNLQNSVFIPYTVYTAIVTLEANTGYTFYGLNADKFVHTGSTGVSNAENTGVVAIEFPRTAEAAPELTSLTVTVSGTVTGPDGVLTPAFSTGVREYTFISYATGNLKFTVNAELEDYATTSFVSPYQTGNIAPAGTELITITVVGSTASTTYTVKVMNGIADGGTLSYVQVGSKWREIHKFTASGTLSVNKVSYDNSVLVIAGGGGGGGGNWPAGGGGAGGYLETNTFNLEAKDYSVEVGAGGGGGRGSKDNNNGADGYNGNDSWFGTRSSYGKDANGLKSRGGGGGGRTYTSAGSRYGNNGHNGGSGGGSGYAGTWNSYGGAAESGQGNGGGGVSNWEDNHAGSGGGAGYGGSEVTATHGGYGNGGGGKWSDIMGSLQLYAEGGSVSNNSSSSVQGNNAAANTGSGGMGGWNSFGGSGGSGIVVVSIPIN